MKKELLKPHSITTLDNEWKWVKQQAAEESITACQFVRKLIRKEMENPAKADSVRTKAG